MVRQNKWFQNAASETGLETDGFLQIEQCNRGAKKYSEDARVRLRQLLARPMRIQNFGKFLSGPGLKAAIAADEEASPHVVALKRKLDGILP